MNSKLKKHLGLIAILTCYLVVAVLYGLTIPIFETPDASGHYAYIHELTEGRGLPVQGKPSGRRVTGYVASHPPLYYAMCAALSWWIPDDMDFEDWAWPNPHQTKGNADRTVNKNILVHTSAERFPWQGTPLTMHISRLVSTLLGIATVVATYGIALELLPKQRWLALGATALAAFNPMFVFTSARVSNDAAVAAFGSLSTWGAVRLATRGLSRRGLMLTGAALGLAGLSKLSGVVLAPAVALALLFDSLRVWRNHSVHPPHQRLKVILRRWMFLGLAALVVNGWWFARNVILYDELMGIESWLSHTDTVRAQPLGILRVIPELGGLEKSYWAVFGWFNITVAPWMYTVWRVLVRASLVGLAVLLVGQSTSRHLSWRARQGLVVAIFAVLLNLGSVWRFVMIVLGAQGRYLMPATASISILLMLGLGQFLPRRFSWSRWRPALAAVIGTSQLAFALLSLFAFILPAYAKPAIVQESELPEAMTRLDLSFVGTPIELLGGHIEAESVRPGDSAAVSLYWRALEPPERDYVGFVQILGHGAEPIAGVDCYPGGGTLPPTLWEPSVVYRDRYELPIVPGADVPTVGTLHAGLRTEDGEQLSVVHSPEQPPLELVLLDRVAVRPVKPDSDDVTHPVGARLGESITLIGYSISDGSVGEGDVITVTLVWHAEAPLDRNYTAFVHLLDSNGKLVDQSDHPPLNGDYPTSFWKAGDVVRDPHRLTIEGAAAGSCTLSMGMYDPETLVRLPAHRRGNHGRFKDDLVVGGGVTIE
jgi:4-amino-4-deoxy-L-arabinose transferase-like glycosyltransferase